LNYTEIVDAAIAYSMRTDPETRDMMPIFLKIVESRLNRSLHVGKMHHRAVINVQENQTYYGLPADFLAIRDIQIKDGATLHYVAPDAMNAAEKDDIYTLIADQLQIHPARQGDVIEMVYSKKLTELSDRDVTNWVSELYPDLYIFGLLVEINAFAKDGPSGEIWNSRFNSAIGSVQLNDDMNRWSGPTLQISIG